MDRTDLNDRVASEAPLVPLEGFRLLAIDLDGTTVRQDGSVARRTRQAIAWARSRGVLVCVATGRMYDGADAFARRLGATGPIICCDGALIRQPGAGAQLFTWPIEPEAAAAVCAAAESAGGGWAAYTDRGRVLGGAARPSLWKAVLRLGRRPWIAWQRLRQDRAQPARRGALQPGECVYKMVAWCADVPGLVEGLADRPLAWPSGIGRRAVEIVAAGVSKGLALSTLAGSLGIAREGIVAFGDGVNDLEMLAYAGCGVAMANASEAVRAAADAITGTVDEEGFARALAMLLDGQRGGQRA